MYQLSFLFGAGVYAFFTIALTLILQMIEGLRYFLPFVVFFGSMILTLVVWVLIGLVMMIG